MCEEKERDSEKLVSEDLREYGQSVVKDDDATIYLISIIGEIEGHECLPSNSKTTKYEHVLPKLAEIEDAANSWSTRKLLYIIIWFSVTDRGLRALWSHHIKKFLMLE